MLPATGRFIQVEAILSTKQNGVTPVLYDLTVSPAGLPTPSPSPVQTETSVATRPAPTATLTSAATDTPTPTPTPRPVYLPLQLREECPQVAEHADVALILDASTSMLEPCATGQSKLEAAKDAIRAFLAAIRVPGDRVALVVYSDRAHLLQPLTGDPGLVTDALSRVTVARQTRMDLALTEAAAELQRGRPLNPDSEAVIILLTDGLPNPVSAEEVVRVADQVKSSGIRVFTIGLGDDVSAELLRQVATTPANYYQSPDGRDLAELYSRIARLLPCPGAVFWPEAR
jgi:Mg-chelatase subunit ChlD